jgi:hypothetical protein
MNIKNIIVIAALYLMLSGCAVYTGLQTYEVKRGGWLNRSQTLGFEGQAFSQGNYNLLAFGENNLIFINGTFIWPNGDVYSGEWTKGESFSQFTNELEPFENKINGQGTYTFANGDVYVGEYKDNYRNGQGTFTFANGDVYAGEYKDGLQSGQGILTRSNGEILDGNWKNDEFIIPENSIAATSAGSVTSDVNNEVLDVKYSSGDSYTGEQQNGILHGQGVYTFVSGEVYIGEFEDGSRTGQGTFTWTNGDIYVGEFQDGPPSGQGTLTWSEGKIYVGEFQDGSQTGQGTLTWPNGDIYVGGFQDGSLSGQGTLTWTSGDIYVGEFQNGSRTGQGTFTWTNGDIYVGEFQDGSLSGKGTRFVADGGIQKGVWTHGVLSNSARSTGQGFNVGGISSGQVIASRNNVRQGASTPSSNTNTASRSNNTDSRRTNSNNKNRSSQSSSSRIDRNKSTCSSYGFTLNTDGHAQCVMYISEGISGQSESQIASAMRQAARIQQQQNREIVAIRSEQQRYLAEVERQRQLNSSLRLMQLGLAIFTGQRPSAGTPIIPPPSSSSAFRTCSYSYGRDIAQYSIPSIQICPLNSSVNGMAGFLTR